MLGNASISGYCPRTKGPRTNKFVSLMKIYNPKEKIPLGHVGPEFMFRIATGRKKPTKTEKLKK